MNISDPFWSLKQECPYCRQGSSLVFVKCPNCGTIIVVCEEAGCFFPNPKNLHENPVDDKCPNCHKINIDDFHRASSDEILALGFTNSEYE